LLLRPWRQGGSILGMHERFDRNRRHQGVNMINPPPTGADSPSANGSDLVPAMAGRIDFPGWIAGVPSRLIGSRGMRPVGVALRLDERVQSGEDFEIAVVDDGAETIMVLGRFGDDEVVAMWRELGATTGLPLVTQSEDGALQHPYPQVGRVQLGRVRIRRRHGLRRRPRFLARRKTARLSRRPTVHREREITGDGRV
jgi:hypothetical protein